MKCLLEACTISFASAPHLGVATLADSISSLSVYEKRAEVFVIIKAVDCFLDVLNLLIILKLIEFDPHAC